MTDPSTNNDLIIAWHGVDGDTRNFWAEVGPFLETPVPTTLATGIPRPNACTMPTATPAQDSIHPRSSSPRSPTAPWRFGCARWGSRTLPTPGPLFHQASKRPRALRLQGNGGGPAILVGSGLVRSGTFPMIHLMNMQHSAGSQPY